MLNSPDDFPGVHSGVTTYIVAANLNIAGTGKFPVEGLSAFTFTTSTENRGAFNLNLTGTGKVAGFGASNGAFKFEYLNDVSLSNFNTALGASGGMISFNYNNRVSLSGNAKAIQCSGGYVQFYGNRDGVQLLNNQVGIDVGYSGQILFDQNSGSLIVRDHTNGALQGGSVCISNNTGSIEFSGNKATIGSSIMAYGGVSIVNNVGNISFERNSSQDRYRGGNIYAQGGEGILIAGNQGRITFTGNSSGAGGAALDSRGNVILAGNHGQILFLENTASGKGSTIYSEQDIYLLNNTGGISFIGNRSETVGGAIRVDGSLLVGANTGNILFEGNNSGLGGAIYSKQEVSLTGNEGNISFLNNKSTQGYGGAISASSVSVTGNMGNVVFRGNSCRVSPEDLVLNSIRSVGSPCRFGSTGGYAVYFYDPVQSSGGLELNRFSGSDAAMGDIVFSGKYVEEDWQNALDRDYLLTQEKKAILQTRKEELVAESRYSHIQGDTVLYGGRLILEDGVTVGNRDFLNGDSSFTAKSGSVLEMVRNSTLAAQTVSLEQGVTLRAGDGAFIRGEVVDMSKGVIVDFMPFMERSGVTIQATESFRMGDHVYVQDTNTNVHYFYADNKWSSEQRFLTFSLEEDSVNSSEGMFDGAASLATGSSSVLSPYAYQGTWSTEWEDSDGDGKADKMFTVWKPLAPENPDDPTNPSLPPGIHDILPELAGGLAMNSSWTSASNIRAVSMSAVGNLGSDRFRMERRNHYWIKGIGDFSSLSSVGTRDGYDYNGGGYALGVDRKITGNAVFGMTFGNVFGKSASRSFMGDIDQSSDIGLFYGGWRRDFNQSNSLSVLGTAGYEWTKNKMKSFHTGGESRGEWENNTILATLRTQWDHSLGKTWNLNVFMGVEYTDVAQNAFRETGWDARQFDKGGMKNMSLPVGFGFGKLASVGEMPWMNTVSVSYVPDVYRENPHANATRLMNGYDWTAKGISPARHSVRINFDSTLAITPNWTAYAGYEFEGRNRAVYHRVNAGISFSY